METTGLNLLIPDKPDAERDRLATAFARRGGVVHRIGRFWDPPVFETSSVRVYGPDSFCLVLQQKLGFKLCSPNDDLLLRVPPKFLQRKLERHPLSEAMSGPVPAFIKPVMPKQFRGAVYQSAAALVEECRGLAQETPVFVAELVSFTSEVRSFVLDGRVLDAAVYEGSANVADAIQFVAALTQAIALPRAVVVDGGYVVGRGWSVIEFNAAWGAGLNGCDPEKSGPPLLRHPALLGSDAPDYKLQSQIRSALLRPSLMFVQP